MLPFRKINSRNMLSCLVASETHVRISPRWFPGQQHVHQSSLCILDTDRHVNDRLLVQRPGLCVVVLQRARRANTYKKSCPICVCVLHSFINLSVCPSVCLPASPKTTSIYSFCTLITIQMTIKGIVQNQTVHSSIIVILWTVEQGLLELLLK